MNYPRFVLGFIAMAATSLLTGCGDDRIPTYQVRGQAVFSDGTPVKFGQIEFYQPDVDLTARGTINKDGTFQLGTFTDNDGAAAGKHQVTISQLIMSGEAGVTPRDHGHHVSQRYAEPGSSKLEFEVAPNDENEFRVELQLDR